MRDDRPKRHFNKPYTPVINDFREYLMYERSLATTTLTSYVFFVCEFMEFVSKGPEEIKREDIKDFIKYLRHKGCQNSSISSYVISLRSFYNWFSDKYKNEGMVEIAFFLQKVIRIRRDKHLIQVPTNEELGKLRATMRAFKDAFGHNKQSTFYKMTLRDMAILEMLVATGARSFEIRAMKVYDIDLNANTVFINRGKGGAQRVAIFSEVANKSLAEYLENACLKAEDTIFIIRNGNMLNYIIKRWAKRAGINPNIHAHSFRHYHVTQAQRNGVPVQIVADQVGHVNLNTTRYYTHLDVDYRREQYGNIEL